MNVPEIFDFRKEPGRTAYLCAVIIVVGLACFALGRLSAAERATSSQAGASLVEATVAGATGTTEAEGLIGAPGASVAGAAVAGGVVVSKSGTKYHFPWCAGAKAIKEENKVWFESTKEARAAGYSAASNCKGLE